MWDDPVVEESQRRRDECEARPKYQWLLKKTILLAAILSLTKPCIACRVPVPSRDALEDGKYESVFLGRVSGVHLLGFENWLVGRYDGTLFGGHGMPMEFTYTDRLAFAELDVVPLQIARGTPSQTLKLRVTKCTARLPELRDTGIFFIKGKSVFPIVVWKREQDRYEQWLKTLGLEDSDPGADEQLIKPQAEAQP